MKRLSIALVLVALFSSSCGGAASPTAGPTTVPQPTSVPTRIASPSSEVDWDDRTLFVEGLIEAERGVLDSLSGATVYHIDLEISSDFLTLAGREELRYTNQETEPLDEVYLRLFPNVAGGSARVSGVKVGGEGVEPAYELQDSALRVPLPDALQPGEAVVIEMDFTVDVPTDMGGNYGLFGYFDGVLVLDEFYPVIPVYDDEAWNVEVPPPNGDLTYLDASFYLVRVTAPSQLILVASGVEIGRELDNDKLVVRFAAGPSRDFYLAASEGYVAISEKVGGTTVNSYSLPELRDGAGRALEHAVDALKSYNTRFGVYPYTEFDVVSTPMQAMGIEYPGLVGLALDLYEPHAEVSGVPSPVLLEAAVAHEVAHQWFYNVVGNDQTDEPWMDEALVQYVTYLYYLDTSGEDAAQGFYDSWLGRWDGVDRAEVPIGRPSGSYTDQKEYGAIVYGRGPLFMATLAERMGRETFDRFLRDYFQSHRWGIGRGEEFRELAERHCQCDLASLFEEWVYEK